MRKRFLLLVILSIVINVSTTSSKERIAKETINDQILMKENTILQETRSAEKGDDDDENCKELAERSKNYIKASKKRLRIAKEKNKESKNFKNLKGQNNAKKNIKVRKKAKKNSNRRQNTKKNRKGRKNIKNSRNRGKHVKKSRNGRKNAKKSRKDRKIAKKNSNRRQNTKKNRKGKKITKKNRNNRSKNTKKNRKGRKNTKKSRNRSKDTKKNKKGKKNTKKNRIRSNNTKKNRKGKKNAKKNHNAQRNTENRKEKKKHSKDQRRKNHKVKNSVKNKRHKKLKNLKSIEGLRQGANSDECVEGLAELGGIFGNQARNFFRQASRALIKASQKSGKSEKKDDFKGVYDLVLEAAGGDSENLKCRGEALGTNDSIKGTVGMLKDCSSMIQTQCGTPLTSAQNSSLTECKRVTEEFRTAYSSLFVTGKPSAAKICENVNNVEIQQLKQDIKNFCASVTDDEKAQTIEKKECDKAFQACRKAERETIGDIDRCKFQPVNCQLEGNLSKADAELELATAQKIKGALDDAERKFGGALEASGKAKGVGDNGQLPVGNSRQEADTSGAGCIAVKEGWIKFNTSATAAVKSPEQEKVDSAKADTVVADLAAISSRSTLAADLESCEVGRQGVFIAIIQIRFYVFWCGWWRVFVIEIRITIIITTYQVTAAVTTPYITATTSTMSITTAETTSTSETFSPAPSTATSAITTSTTCPQGENCSQLSTITPTGTTTTTVATSVTITATVVTSNSESTITSTVTPSTVTSTAISTGNTKTTPVTTTTLTTGRTTGTSSASSTSTTIDPIGVFKCGVKKKNTRIVGGQQTEVLEYPWIVILADDFGGFCGGTLVAAEWILTAAHCISVRVKKVIIGEHDKLNPTDGNRKVLTPEQIFTHEQFGGDLTYANDIALIKLKEKVDLNTFTPACLPAKGTSFVGRTAYAYGWGSIFASGPSSTFLQDVALPVVSFETCKSTMDPAGAYTILSGMLCAGGKAGEDGCQGDSGGPLTVPDETTGQHYLIGDTSWGYGCGQAGLYGVWGDVAFYRDWLTGIFDANGGATFNP